MYVKNKDMDPEIQSKIMVRWNNELEDYQFADNMRELHIGWYIKYTNMELKKLSGGILVKIITDSFGIKLLVLKSPAYHTIWYLRPKKFYIFQRKTETDPISKFLEHHIKKREMI
jgi:hypothetical protein